MQNPTTEAPHKQDPRDNGVIEDSNLMTIEYLRARLHAERSVSKAARERANELEKRVKELEQQLAVVTLEREKAEKATFDVLAVLENNGFSEVSEALYSGSDDEEESDAGSNACRSKLGLQAEMQGQGRGQEESSRQTIPKGDHTDELSGSERDSTSSGGRALSWKLRKEADRPTAKEFFDSSLQRWAHLTRSGSSSPGLRRGKSCRQVQRREIRSVVEGSQSTNVAQKDADDNGAPSTPADCLDSGSEETKGSGNWNEKVMDDSQVSVTSESHGHGHESDGEMERALEHKAQLIGQHEEQEKAQREWEEKYRESNNSTPDSCEPSNQSDVTEERDEARAASSQPAATTACDNSDEKSDEAAIHFSKQPSFMHFNSFKLSPNADLESSQARKLDEMPDCRAAASDFAFPVMNNARLQLQQDFLENNIVHSHPDPSSQAHPLQSSQGRQSLSSSASSPGRTCNAEAPGIGRESYALIIPHEGHHQRVERVLDNLHSVKLLLKKECGALSLLDSGPKGRPVDHSVSTRRGEEIWKMPVSSGALFWVPTDFESESAGQKTTLADPDYSIGSPHQYPHLVSSVVGGGEQYHLRRSMTTRPSSSSFDHFHQSPTVANQNGVSAAQEPWSDYHPNFSRTASSREAGNPLYSSYHEMERRVPPMEMSSNQFSSGRAAGVSPPNSSLYHNSRVGPNMYRY